MSTKSKLRDLTSEFYYSNKEDKKRIAELEKTINGLIQENGTLNRRLQCAAKIGHEFELDRKVVQQDIWTMWSNIGLQTKPIYTFIFKCKLCGLEIEKCKDELTPKECKALIDLGVLEKPQPTTKSKKKAGENERNTPKPKCN